MNIFIKSFVLSLSFIAAFLLSGCDDSNKDTAQPQKPSNHIKVGVIAGAELKLAEEAKKVAKEKYNLDVEIVVMTDYVMPNRALAAGDIDVNVFQHRPFLNQQIKERGYDLVVVGNTFIYPIAAYSKNIKSLAELKDGDTIAIPNDPTNLARSLFLLQKQGLIKLNDNVGDLPTILDIKENPRNFNIVELDAPQLPRVLDDKSVAFAIINTAYSSQIGLMPATDGLFMEDKDSPYVNIIVARADNKDSEQVKDFVKSYQSDEVYQLAQKEFKNSAIKGW